MPKQRDSVRHAEWSKRYESNYEKLACAIAFEAGAEIVIRGLEAFILIGGTEEHLCTSDRPKRLWWHIWTALNERFPALKRYK
jgi:hypothetical protein